ncbi:hypothetical protein HanIR_Chr11g0512141 [Helianthus annuus]|nr:hypothetical protein HanIR_Chr11g0512141 [Helianthus annuus]
MASQLNPQMIDGCKIDLVGQVFDFDLPSTTLDGFEAVVKVDWLFRYRAEIPYKKLVLRILLPSGGPLPILKCQRGARVSASPAMRAHKCLRMDDAAMLATVSDDKTKENRIEDPPIVCDSSQCATFRFTSITVRRNLS